MKLDKNRALPFTLTGFIILTDQLVKFHIVKNWPREGSFIADVFNNGVLRIYHVRNKAVAFSLGSGVPDALRPFLFILLPLAVLGFLLWYYLKSGEFSRLQRWAVAGIIGGGIGNLVDRIFRPDGVVDFISVSLKFIPLRIFNPWPTFNIADTGVVICCAILLLTMLRGQEKSENKAAS